MLFHAKHAGITFISLFWSQVAPLVSDFLIQMKIASSAGIKWNWIGMAYNFVVSFLSLG